MRTAGWGGRGTLDRGFVAGTIRCAFATQRKPHDEPWSCGTNPRIRARSTVVHASCRPHWAPIYPKCHLPRRDGLTCLSLDITDIRARSIWNRAPFSRTTATVTSRLASSRRSSLQNLLGLLSDGRKSPPLEEIHPPAKRGEPSISSRGVNLGSATRPCSYCSSAACGVFRKLIAIRL